MKSPVPEWVHVWAWARRNGAVRPFPQQRSALRVSEQKNMLTEDEYADLLERWKSAGSPLSLDPIGDRARAMVRHVR